MIMDETQIDYSEAEVLLKRFGSVRKAIDAYKNGN